MVTPAPSIDPAQALQPDGSYVVESRTTAGTVYRLAPVNGFLSCDCAAGVNGRACWHWKAINPHFVARKLAERAEAAGRMARFRRD